jgi:hypothetical protein
MKILLICSIGISRVEMLLAAFLLRQPQGVRRGIPSALPSFRIDKPRKLLYKNFAKRRQNISLNY